MEQVKSGDEMFSPALEERGRRPFLRKVQVLPTQSYIVMHV